MKNDISFEAFHAYLYKNCYTLWTALNHHKTHTNKNLTLKNHHYIKAILLDKSNQRILKKSTQGGISECLIVISWVAASQGSVVFYVLPTDHLMQRFVSNRYEKSLVYSDYYRTYRVDTKTDKLLKRDINASRSLKDIGKGVISFAGSMSDVPFIEIPADWLIVDEADKCDANRLQMALERLGHSSDPHEIYVGNPTFVGSFLDEKFNQSTAAEWGIQAECGHTIFIDFFKHIVRQEDEFTYVIRDKDYEPGENDIRPICDKCEKPFDRFGYGEFVAKQKSEISGKHISRLFSGTSTLVKMVDNFSKALENDYKMQRFYNSDLGLSYTASGAKITREMIVNNCMDYKMPSKIIDGVCIIGVDVGNVLHVKINKLLNDNIKQSVFIGTCNDLIEIYELCDRFKVIAGVIDGLPEIRMARLFSHSANGRFRCFFGTDKSDSINPKEKSLTVSRLMSIDNMKELILKKELIFPKDITNYEEYLQHMITPVRVWDDDKQVYSWESNQADHFFFAEVYASLAEKILKFMS
ncbi:MAG: terminase gpA endonuclease subunit [Promethearchaeota archaeon]